MSALTLLADAEVIHSYTRAQALADGVLIDVSAPAREAGFRAPVALTAAAWADSVAWDRDREACPQDERGRLWDVLTMARFAAGGAPGADRIGFGVLRVQCGQSRPTLARLVLAIGAGDLGEPVMTIMLPGED